MADVHQVNQIGDSIPCPKCESRDTLAKGREIVNDTVLATIITCNLCGHQWKQGFVKLAGSDP